MDHKEAVVWVEGRWLSILVINWMESATKKQHRSFPQTPVVSPCASSAPTKNECLRFGFINFTNNWGARMFAQLKQRIRRRKKRPKGKPERKLLQRTWLTGWENNDVNKLRAFLCASFSVLSSQVTTNRTALSPAWRRWPERHRNQDKDELP